MELRSIGTSHLEAPIFSYILGEGKEVLILGGIHGDEIEGVAFTQALLSEVLKRPIPGLSLHIIPQANPDGFLLKTRANAKGVDLNRNLPTKDWDPKAFTKRYYPGEKANSEPENQALTKYIEDNAFRFVISFHSFHKYLLNVNGDCSPYAEIIHEKTAYPIEASMGYPTPGCLGTYTGLERGIPTITYELERDKNMEELIELHMPAVRAALEKMSEEL